MEQIIVKELMEYDVIDLFHKDYSLDLIEKLEEKNNELKKALGLHGDAISFYKRNRKCKIKFSGIAGVISIHNYEIEIMPKFLNNSSLWRESLFNMIYFAQSGRIHAQVSNRMDRSRMNFYDHVALMFIEQMEEALSQEKIHAYRSISESSRFLRGRLLVKEQLKTIISHPGIVTYEHDIFDCENQFNFLLGWCTDMLIGKVRNVQIKGKLREIRELLPKVNKMYSIPVDAVLPPQYAHYVKPIEIANSLAIGYSFSHQKTGKTGYSYVVATEVIYEKFIERILKSIKSEKCLLVSEAQSSVLFAKAESKNMRSYYTKPDNKIYVNGLPRMLIDAKYKNNFMNEKGKKPVNSDVYQLFSSLIAHNCEFGVLISPCESENAVNKYYWEIEDEGKSYRICSLSVDMSDLSNNEKINNLKTVILDFIINELQLKGEAS